MLNKRLFSTALLTFFILSMAFLSVSCSFRKTSHNETYKFTTFKLQTGVSTSIGELQLYEEERLDTYFNIKSTDVVMETAQQINEPNHELIDISSMSNLIDLSNTFHFTFLTQIGITYNLDVFVWIDGDSYEKDFSLDYRPTSLGWDVGYRTLSLLTNPKEISDIDSIKRAVSEFMIQYFWNSKEQFDFDQNNFDMDSIIEVDDLYAAPHPTGKDVIDSYNNGSLKLKENNIYLMQVTDNSKDKSSTYNNWQQASLINNGYITVKVQYTTN